MRAELGALLAAPWGQSRTVTGDRVRPWSEILFSCRLMHSCLSLVSENKPDFNVMCTVWNRVGKCEFRTAFSEDRVSVKEP